MAYALIFFAGVFCGFIGLVLLAICMGSSQITKARNEYEEHNKY